MICRRTVPRITSFLLIFLPLAICNSASAQTIPNTDADLDALKNALLTGRQSAKTCVRGSCATFDCNDAIALGTALDDAHVAMAVLEESLHEYFQDEIQKQRELNQEYEDNQKRDETLRAAFIFSKMYSDWAKVFLDAADWIEFAQHLSEAYKGRAGFELDDKVLSKDLGYQMGLATRYSNDMQGLAKRVMESVDHLKEIYHNLNTDSAEKALSELEEVREKAARLDTVLSDVAGGISDVKINLAKYKAAQRTGVPTKMKDARRELGTSWTNFAKLAAKFGLDLAEFKQGKLLEELKDIGVVQTAINKNFASRMEDTNRILNRYAKGRELRVLAADIFSQHNVCMAQCRDAPYPKPIPHRSEYDRTHFEVAGPTKTPSTELLKTYNAKVPAITDAITQAASKFVAKEGTKPQISVNPQKVAKGESVSAKFSLATCKATEGAQIELLGISTSEVIDNTLGPAKPADPGSIEFKAPGPPGDYAVRIVGIVDSHHAVLASDGFSVVEAPAASTPDSKSRQPAKEGNQDEQEEKAERTGYRKCDRPEEGVLRGYLDEVLKASDDAEKLYDFSPAHETLRASFRKHNVPERGYGWIEAWGDWVFTRYVDSKGPLLGYYRSYSPETASGALADSIDYLCEGGSVIREDMQRISDQMKDWRSRKDKFFRNMEAYVNNDAEEAATRVRGYDIKADTPESRALGDKEKALEAESDRLKKELEALLTPPPIKSLRRAQ